uniref:Uncharacterized protein n=1 Tax=Eucampia antarctica TaxID=49252 RepID=A0A7S2R0B8_9STRA|mmetsp:Transcript_11081/g.10613  ORF Transcript_11081/g.10613 Transcript_11081/m.10613 type:complete len:198 (+) Transcript_11081:52-645(+)
MNFQKYASYAPFFTQKKSNPLGFLMEDKPSRPEDHLQNLNYLSKFLLVLSLFFFSWAVYNTVTMDKGFDLGVVSFSGAAFSAIYLYVKTRNNIKFFSPLRSWEKILVVISQLIVAANYGFGVYFALNVGNYIYVRFATYCIIFIFVWIGLSIYTWILIGRTTYISLNEDDEDELDDLYGFAINESSMGMYNNRRNMP